MAAMTKELYRQTARAAAVDWLYEHGGLTDDEYLALMTPIMSAPVETENGDAD